MAMSNMVSVAQFLEALKQQESIASIIAGADSLDISDLSIDEEKTLVKELKKFAGTQNGPMLIMGLPGHLQALLSLSGTIMPGLDRLSYLKATPRQVVNCFLRGRDDRRLSSYPFEKISKADWRYYLLHCEETPVRACFNFLKHQESEGGFSGEEIGAIALANRSVIGFLPIDRIDPDSVVELLLSGEMNAVWRNCAFCHFEKHHWYAVLKHANIPSVPKECEKFLRNQDGIGFSNSELIELAHCCKHISKWINQDITEFKDAYDLYVKGHGDDLWERFDFTRLSKSEWEILLGNPVVDIPDAFAGAVASELFTFSELCDFARKNEKVVSFLPIECLCITDLTDLLILYKDDRLWNEEVLSRLDAKSWIRIIKEKNYSWLELYLRQLRGVEGFTEEQVREILSVDYHYAELLPVNLIAPDMAVDCLLSGVAEGLWDAYPFSMFSEDNWFALLDASSHPVPELGKQFLSNPCGTTDVNRLNALLSQHLGLYVYMNPRDILPERAVDILMAESKSPLWSNYDFGRFSRKQIFTIIIKAEERHLWPRIIVEMFSECDSAFADDEVLNLAEKNTANVLDLLSVGRILKSGASFFGKLCEMAARSRQATATVVRKLANGDRPWLKLDQELLTIAMVAIPLTHKFIAWKEFDFDHLSVLLSAHPSFYEEWYDWRKIRFKFWRHRHVYMVAAAFAVCVVSYGIVAAVLGAVERATESRRNYIVCRINDLALCKHYDDLARYIDKVRGGPDSCVLDYAKVHDARLALEQWEEARKAVIPKLRALKGFYDVGWDRVDPQEVENCISFLAKSEVLLDEEQRTITEYQMGYCAWCAKVAQQNRNVEIARGVNALLERCNGAETIEAVCIIWRELDALSKDMAIDESNSKLCLKAKRQIESRAADLFQQQIGVVLKRIDSATTLQELDDVACVAKTMLACGCVCQDLSEECHRVLMRVDARRQGIVEANKRRQVEDVSKSVSALVEMLSHADDSSLSDIVMRFESLPRCDSFEQYRLERVAEYSSLSNGLALARNGIECANRIRDVVGSFVAQVSSNAVAKSDIECAQQYSQDILAWQSEYATVVKWRVPEMESMKKDLDSCIRNMNERLELVALINGSTDYGALYDSLQKLLQTYPDCYECRQIDASRILTVDQVDAAITKSGWFTREKFCDYVGVVKVSPKNPSDVVPLLLKPVSADAAIYCVELRDVDKTGELVPKVRQIFDRTDMGVCRKVRGVDYEKCQGIGLFVCNDPDYVDMESWCPGIDHPKYPHWIASSEHGRWVPEPGYRKTGLSRFLSVSPNDIEWDPGEEYLNGSVRTGQEPGEWLENKVCSFCSGSGMVHGKKETWRCAKCDGCGRVKRKLKCERCRSCNFKGYIWSQPYKCPDCNGRGAGYTELVSRCTHCEGKGRVWEMIEDQDELLRVLREIKEELVYGDD